MRVQHRAGWRLAAGAVALVAAGAGLVLGTLDSGGDASSSTSPSAETTDTGTATTGGEPGYTTPEVAAAHRYGPDYLGLCAGLAAGDDRPPGALCSTAVPMGEHDVVLLAGPPFGEATELLLVGRTDGRWSITDTYAPNPPGAVDPGTPAWARTALEADTTRRSP